MLEGKFRTAFDERELAPDVEAVAEGTVEEFNQAEFMGKLVEDIKRLKAHIKEGDLQNKSVDELNKELEEKVRELEKLEKENGFTVIEEI